MKIISISTKTQIDESPDFSYMGEYTNTESETTIDRGNVSGNQYKYFEPCNPEYGEQDYERMEGYNNCEGSFIGISKIAEVEIGGVIQEISSGALWGVETDGNKEYLDDIIFDQFFELSAILQEMGFSVGDIKRAEHKDEEYSLI